MFDWEGTLGQFVDIDIDYYNKEHKTALAQYSTAGRIQELVVSGLRVPVPEFLTYFLFHKIRAQPSQYAGYAAVRHAISDAYGMLSDYVELKSGALHLSPGTAELPKYVIEYLGESAGLSVMNGVHGLTEADWVPIDTRFGVKTLDYQHASDGSRVIQLETKGSATDDRELKSSSISNLRADVEAKKKSVARPDGNTLRYGTITVITGGCNKLRTWLLDPLSDAVERTPRDFRAIARLEFLRWIIWLVSPKSQLATALATRVSAVRALRDPYELATVPLSQADGTSFDMQTVIATDEIHPPFFATRSRVSDGPAGGAVVPTRDGDGLVFIGFRAELLELAANQKFDEMLGYSAQVAANQKTVLCNVPSGEFARFGMDESMFPGFSRSGAYVRFRLSGTLNYSQEGLVFGLLPARPN